MSEGEDPYAFASPKKRPRVSFSFLGSRSVGSAGGGSAGVGSIGGVGSVGVGRVGVGSGTGEEGRPSGASKKKQRVLVAKFRRGMKRGSAIRSSPTHVRKDLQTVNRATVSMRRLSSPQVEMPSDQSLLVQYDDANDDFQKLVSKVERMSTTLNDQHHELNDLRKKVSALSKKHEHDDLFMEDSQELAIRAFLDYVLQKFYEAAKVEQRDTVERGRWLFSPEAEAFVEEHKYEPLVFKEFNNSHVVINTTLLQRLQIAKRTSSNLSSATCHSSKPVKVAIAFQELHQFKKDQELKAIFKEIFGMDPGDMVQNYDDGEREKFLTTFTVWK